MKAHFCLNILGVIFYYRKKILESLTPFTPALSTLKAHIQNKINNNKNLMQMLLKLPLKSTVFRQSDLIRLDMGFKKFEHPCPN